MEGFEKSSICLTVVNIENFCSFLFANLDPNAESMEEWFLDVRQELSSFALHIEQLKPLEWVDVPERCNWKVSVENYSECDHGQLNHPTFANGMVKSSAYGIQLQGYCLRHTTEC